MYDDSKDDSSDVLDSDDNDTSETEHLKDKSRTTTPAAEIKSQKFVKEKDTKDEKSKAEDKGSTALIAPSDYENIYSNRDEQVTPKAILKSTRGLEPKSLRKRIQILAKDIRKETNKEVQFPEDF